MHYSKVWPQPGVGERRVHERGTRGTPDNRARLPRISREHDDLTAEGDVGSGVHEVTESDVERLDVVFVR
eukprot:5771528-Pyramimonas_sp.AAC.1